MPPNRPVPTSVPTGPFPRAGLLPKEATRALHFLKQYDYKYDGRGVRVAVLDTGIDPAAAGLDGPGKIVDVIDCTGSGDVPVEVVKPLEATSGDTAISGAIALPSPSGRTLLASPNWKNPTGEWKVGMKPAYDLWPGGLVTRRKKERKQEFEKRHHELLVKAQKELVEFEKELKSRAGKKGGEGADEKGGEEEAKKEEKGKEAAKERPAGPSTEDLLKKEDLAARVQALKDLMSSYDDVGPIIEAIVWHDGSAWRVAVGGGEGGALEGADEGKEVEVKEVDGKTVVDLRARKTLTDFRSERQWDVFGKQDLMTFTVNILEEGNLLSIVVPSGSHGTHVAGIIGAHHPSTPELNGVAPGCEIVSMKIGDTRLGSMETGQALLRAASALVETETDVANLSYGEDFAFGVEDKGAFIQALRDEVVRKRDIVFVSSAGNNGPALTTVGAPGGNTSSVISVGAHVSAGEMQKAEYALIESVPDSVTTWCSRGPTSDGDRGVTIYAPGAAITSIPRYCLQKEQLMNGTSMSSPNACGGVALIMSGLKSEGIKITPHRIKKALEITGKDIGDPLAVPYLQVDKAYEYIQQHKDLPDQDADFIINVVPHGRPLPDDNQKALRGVYLREYESTRRVFQGTVSVKPYFKEEDTERKYDLDLKLALSAAADWIKKPDYVSLGGNGRQFEIRVDPTDLAPGLHYTSIDAYDTAEPGRLVFSVPVTVAKPEVPESPLVKYSNLSFTDTASLYRRFVAVPAGATWAEVRIRTRNHPASVRFWLHLVQLVPQTRLHQAEKAWVLAMNEDETVIKRMPVKGGLTMEVCMAKMWTSVGTFDLDLEIDFHGLNVVTGRDRLTIFGGEGLARVEAVNTLRVEQFTPSISFETRRTFIRPTESIIRPLTGRDTHPNGKRMYELILTYSDIKQSEKGKVTYSLPVGGNLYDNSLAVLAQLFDANKKRLVFSDVYPAKETQLNKGDYVLKVQLVHEAISVLEKLKNAAVRWDSRLAKPKEVTLEMYDDHVDAFGERKPASFNSIKLMPGDRKIIAFSTDMADKLPKEAKGGDILLGHFSFVNDAAAGGWQLAYVVPPKPVDPKPDVPAAKEEQKLVDLQVEVAKKISNEEEKEEFIRSLVSSHPTHLPVLVLRLETLNVEKTDAQELIKAADAVLEQVDEEGLAKYFGVKRLPASQLTAEEKKEQKEMEGKRDALLTAYNRKAGAFLSVGDKEKVEETFKAYSRFADTSNHAFAVVFIKREMMHGRYGSALVAAQKLKKDTGSGEEEGRKARELEKECISNLGWKAWEEQEKKRRIVDFPKDYAPF